jgi:hypothetical protein
LQIADDDTPDEAKAKIEAGIMPLFAHDEPEPRGRQSVPARHRLEGQPSSARHPRGPTPDPQPRVARGSADVPSHQRRERRQCGDADHPATRRPALGRRRKPGLPQIPGRNRSGGPALGRRVHAADAVRAAARAAFAAARDTATAIRSAAAHGATAGLALAALGRGDLNSAMREVEVLLRQHDHDASFGGAERPAAIELACYRVLDQAGDARAPEWLRRIHAKVQANAAAIDDPALVSMFLANIPEHRQIVAAFAAQRAD